MPHNTPLDQNLRSALETGSNYPVAFYTEYLDLMRFPDDLHQQKLVDYLRVKYSDFKIDLIVVVSPLALNFLVERGKELFPKTPIVFTSIGIGTLERLSLQRNMTGIAVKGDIRDTLEIALGLQPDTLRVVIPTGTSALEKSWAAQTRKSLHPLESRVAITYLTDLSMSEVLSRLSNLPPHTVVVFASLFFYDADRRYFLPEQALDLICRSSNAPVYGTERPFVGTGIVGGHVYDMAEVGAAAGKLGRRILAGEKPGDIPIRVLDPNYNIFDARQLRRWGLSEGRLPPGSIVLYRQPTVWQSSGRYILGAALLLLAQTLLIFGLLWQRARRRKTEAKLFVINNRLRLALQSGKAVGWEWDLKTGRDSWFGDLKTMFGIQSDTYVGRPEDFYRYVHPEDRQHVSEAVAEARKNRTPYAAEFRVVWPDGTLRFVAARGKFYYSRNGEPVRMVGMAQDITERKRAEQALRESEERLHLAVEAGKMYAFEWDAVTDVIVRSAHSACILNWMDDPTRDTRRQFAARVHPDDRDLYAVPESVCTPGNPKYQIAYRVLRPDGSVIWLEAIGHVFFDGAGKIRHITGMVADVTERKLAEEAVTSLSHRLIEAQERERARIARDLHDDLSQRMALLQITLEQLASPTAGLSSSSRRQLHDLTKVTTEISSSIHDLSHQLHPFKLETLGLVAALGGFCNEFSRQYNLLVQFVHRDVPRQIPKEVALCLFRVAQEALRNVVKHSGAAEAKVEVVGHGDQIDLCVSDSGAGLSPQSARGERGLGLISMRERLRLVGGHLAVESEPSRGTRIRVCVPLPSSNSELTDDERAQKAGA